jgi:hypothetical protein
MSGLLRISSMPGTCPGSQAGVLCLSLCGQDGLRLLINHDDNDASCLSVTLSPRDPWGSEPSVAPSLFESRPSSWHSRVCLWSQHLGGQGKRGTIKTSFSSVPWCGGPVSALPSEPSAASGLHLGGDLQLWLCPDLCLLA